MIEFFIKQHKLLNLIIIGILGLGSYYFVEGQKEGFPNIGLDSIYIMTVYPGATADEVQSLITEKIEDAIDSVSGRDKILSSSTEGLSTVVFQADTLDSNIKVEDIEDNIKKEVDKIKKDLPEDAEEPSVLLIRFNEVVPIIRVFVVSDQPLEERKKIIKEFRNDLRKIDGVSKTEKVNYPKTQLWVSADPIKLKKYEIDIDELTSAIKSANINFPSGKVTENNQETLVKTYKPYNTVEDVANTIIRGNDNSQVIKVKDVAISELTPEEINDIIEVDGESGIGVTVFKSLGGDIIKVADGVKETIEIYKKKYPEINIFYVDDFSYYVKRRFNVLASNATMGLFLVFLCLIIFFEFRVTFWTTLGIPVSLCLSVIISYQMGITLNLMSMFGYIIVIGMLVDDAIIIAENIYSKYESGMPMMESAIEGTREMLVPILAIVSTTAVAFLPLMLLPGIFGEVLGIIPQIVVITMVASFVESVLILPGHIAYMKNKRHNSDGSLKGEKQPRAWFLKLKELYGRSITYLTKRPLINSIIMVLICLGIIVGIGSRVPFIFFPGQVETIIVNLETDKTSSLEKTQLVARDVESKLRKVFGNDMKSYISKIGSVQRGDGPVPKRTYYANVELKIDPGYKFVEKELIKKIEEVIDGTENLVKYQARGIKGGPPAGNPVEVKILANNAEYLDDMIDASTEVKNFISQIPNTTSVNSTYEEGKDEIYIRIDEDKASLYKVALGKIGAITRTAFQGTKATIINTFKGVDEEVEVVVKLDEDIATKDTIPNLIVKNKTGRVIPFNAFITNEVKTSQGQIDKEDQVFYFVVSSQLKDSFNKEYNAQKINGLVGEQFSEWEKKYPNLSFKFGGEQESQKELMNAGIMSAMLSIFGVFVILVAIFKSYIQPLIIMSILPFIPVGVVIGLYLHGDAIGLMPLLGLVALTGVVVNDSLVLVNQINVTRKNTNQDVLKTIIDCSKDRLRPIMMTSITTVVGLIPIAYGIGGSEPFIAPMALSFLWGIAFTTLIILFLLPNIYLLNDKFLKFAYKRILKKEYRYDD